MCPVVKTVKQGHIILDTMPFIQYNINIALHISQNQYPKFSEKFNWGMVLAYTWFFIGFIIDGWAHHHVKVTETFFTPWHAILYSGFLSVALFLLINSFYNYRRGYSWKKTLPEGYNISLIGILVFLCAGFFDFFWHIFFGFELSIEILLSPTHLLLATGGTLMISGVVRASQRNNKNTFVQQLPLIIAAGYMIALFGFMTQYAHPFVVPYAAVPFITKPISYGQALGISGIILQTALLMGVILFVIKRDNLKPGAYTIILTLNAFFISFMKDHYIFIIPSLLTGIIIDFLLLFIFPRIKSWSLHIFSFFLPITLFTFYFVTLYLSLGVWWSTNVWAGGIVLAGVTGLLLSFLTKSYGRTKL